MKRLKFSSPFGGKRYPLAAVAITLIICMIVTVKTSISGIALFFVMFCVPLLVLACCFFNEQRLTTDERILCESAEMPLWEPVSPELAIRVRERNAKDSISVVKAALISLGFGAFLMIYVTVASKASIRAEGSSTTPAIVAFIGAFVLLGILLFSKMERETWADIDESAVCIRVPVHHTYSVRHSGASNFTRDEQDESFFVCYLPDGRYTLHDRLRSGAADTVLIVKFRNMVCWMPEAIPEATPETEPETAAAPEEAEAAAKDSDET